MSTDAAYPESAVRRPRIERIVSPDGRIEVEVAADAGGRLHRIRVDGIDVLRTPDDPAMALREPVLWGAYPMAPWCNRIGPGVVEVAGRRVVLTANFRDGSAMHGDVYRRPWDVAGPGRFLVAGGGNAAWPWPYEVTMDVAATGDTVIVGLALRNSADVDMPGGVGLHPWFRRPVDVAVNAERVYPSNIGSPAQPASVSGVYDLRRLGPLALGLDATWTDLAEPAVQLRWPTLGLRAEMRATAARVLVCAASPANIEATAVEVQTHAPQGLERLLSGGRDPMAWVPPGQELRLGLELEFRHS